MSADETPSATPSQVPPTKTPAEKLETVPLPPANPPTNPPTPSADPVLAPMPSPAAPRETAKRYDTSAGIAPVQRSRDLGAMDLSGLAGQRPSPAVESSRLDMSGFTAQTD